MELHLRRFLTGPRPSHTVLHLLLPLFRCHLRLLRLLLRLRTGFRRVLRT